MRTKPTTWLAVRGSFSQVIEKILDSYLRHGMPPREVLLGDTTPTRPGIRSSAVIPLASAR